jgi:hypothetical protein
MDPSKDKFGCRPVNVGTGHGSTVLEMVAAMEVACGHEIKRAFAPRRQGDTQAVWASTLLAEKELGWKARFTVEDMCRDQWNWAKRFPHGYEEPLSSQEGSNAAAAVDSAPSSEVGAKRPLERGTQLHGVNGVNGAVAATSSLNGALPKTGGTAEGASCAVAQG